MLVKKNATTSSGHSLIFGFLIVFLLLFNGCTDNSSKREMVIAQMKADALEERIAKYKATRQRRCYDGLVQEANRLVDSILFEELKLASDTIAKPFKPSKPLGKEKKTLNDTTPVQPFIPDSLNSNE